MFTESELLRHVHSPGVGLCSHYFRNQIFSQGRFSAQPQSTRTYLFPSMKSFAMLTYMYYFNEQSCIASLDCNCNGPQRQFSGGQGPYRRVPQ